MDTPTAVICWSGSRSGTIMESDENGQHPSYWPATQQLVSWSEEHETTVLHCHSAPWACWKGRGTCGAAAASGGCKRKDGLAADGGGWGGGRGREGRARGWNLDWSTRRMGDAETHDSLGYPCVTSRARKVPPKSTFGSKGLPKFATATEKFQGAIIPFRKLPKVTLETR